MRISKGHRILVATDGSPSAQAALGTAGMMPWTAAARVRAVIARTEWIRPESEAAVAALNEHYGAVAQSARQALSSRWPNPDVVVVDQQPVDGILCEAEAFDATLIALGWRGHGTFHRVLAGSVSRAVAARAACPVLVVREAQPAICRFVVGFDASPNADRAIDFMCSLEAGREHEIVLVDVVEPVPLPASTSLLPAHARAHLRHEVEVFNAERRREAEKLLAAATDRVARCGWSAKGEVRVGAPLERLLSAVDDHRADLLVMGARAVTGLERALLGSVANGALNHSRVPVLLVR